MKRCDACGQILAQRITTCPACGSEAVAGLTAVDDYKIQHIIHEGRSSIVCRALKEGHQKPVTIRLFTDRSGVNQTIADRLEKELKVLSKLPPDLFVQHYAIHRSASGLWYRVSEWVDADNWGSIFVSGLLNDQRRLVTLFYNIASALDILHRHDHFMPYLILDDILLPKHKTRNLSVKLNYKLSRFLNARATHHGPMLQKLLAHHPDIINGRAIDFRTGIWSLGKVFIEILASDPNLIRFSEKVDDIKGLDPELAVLIKVMLSDDPDLRPQSMSKVTAALGKILERMPSQPLFKADSPSRPGLLREISRLKRLVVVTLLIIAAVLGANAFMAWNEKDGIREQGFSQRLEAHTRSIGFLVVEYWLEAQDDIVYRNKVEGTAFLTDKEGYILTNRHVACPWLEDPTLFRVKNKHETVEFGHRMFLWFEGARAFNRLQGLESSGDLADAYYLAGAFRSDGKSRLRVAGVPRGTGTELRGIHALFKHDFAVLKIDTLPENALPLPLAGNLAPEQIKRLSPVIIMGFPLGSRTQGNRINASITRGHVRRTSPDLIQVDSSIYKGNSGGPAINAEGEVIGIASGVVTDRPSGQIPLFTPLSDFGLVLPIAEPAAFIEDLKSGTAGWDGVLDFSLEKKIHQVTDLALNQKIQEASDLSDRLLKQSQDPALLFTAGLVKFCADDLSASRDLFTRLIAMEKERMMPRFMIQVIDSLTGSPNMDGLARNLLKLDWGHPEAFTGYLAQVISSGQLMDPRFLDYENPSEKAWRQFADGLILERNSQLAEAMALYKEVALTAGANDHLFLMATARLSALRRAEAAVAGPPKKKRLKEHHQAFDLKVAAEREKARTQYQTAVDLIRKFESPKTEHKEKLGAATALMELSPKNRTIIGRLAFYHAGRSEWDQTLSYIHRYFAAPCRETGLSLSLDLLKGQMFALSGQNSLAEEQLRSFQKKTKIPWYGILAKHLLDSASDAEERERKLVKLSGRDPARLITLHTALGLDAESRQDLDRAGHHYREALGTYLDDWNEYDLARTRLLGFRKTE